jgi:nucleoid-associated protein EbfC
MLGNIGQIMSLMKNLPKLQASMQEMQEKLAQVSVEGNAGAGMVVVTVNGRMEVTKCVISEDAMKLNDRDMLADLVAAAVKASAAIAQEAGLPIAPGMIPGF